MIHPQAEAIYTVVPLEGAGFGIEVRAPEAEPALVRSFATVDEAETWITKQKARIAGYRPPRRYSQRLLKP